MTYQFLHDDFFLESDTAKQLYHDYAENMPIFDYHNHLPPDQIAEDVTFKNLTQIWLGGDHYKWRAMRTNGIDERYITGDAPDEEKFNKWAETVPFTIRNPLYHWTHLELRRYFHIETVLNPSTAGEIYTACNEKLNTPECSVRNLLRRMNVKVVCTTDDPVDDLRYHRKIREDQFEIKVVPAFRPDKLMGVEDVSAWNQYLDKLAEVTNREINCYNALLEAMQERHTYFHQQGCRISDHGLETVYAEDFTLAEINTIFQKLRSKHALTPEERAKYNSALMLDFGRLDAEKGWVQQLHIGALRNNNTKMFQRLGRDTGFDSMGDSAYARPLATFLDRLNQETRLPKTILYNLHPKDNAMLAAMIGNFQDGSVPGKMQFGAAWWFLDQRDGIERQLEVLSQLGLLSRFVGMLTDSRSFLSFPRHEYFRRILCHLIGNDVEKGLIPNDQELLSAIIKNICYYNARNYFEIDPDD